jgi:UDP:flavonoid glycosyltransferase YjiC (YdhE family)
MASGEALDTKSRNILITPVGSAGDNYPFIGLGIELARRGHRVTVITNDHFKPLIRGSGLEFVSVGTTEEFDRIIANPEIWHPTRGLKRIMEAVAEQSRRLFDAVSQRIADKPLIIAHTLDFGSRAMAERDPSLPVVTVHLAPSVIRTNYDMGAMKGTRNPSFLPHWAKRMLWWAVDKWMIDPAAGPVVNEMRARLGLVPIRRIFERALHSPRLTVGLWPEWFARRQPDAPAFFKQTGFPLFDGGDGAQPVSPEVDGYLRAGEPPIVFTPGSANVHAHEFFAAAAQTAELLGRRTLLLSRSAEHLPTPLPSRVRHFPFAPLSKILPRCAALVHHGGIGTTAAGLAGGVPQLIMPMSHDQPNNAHWVHKLGVGDRLMPAKFTGPRVAKILGPLLESAAVKERCAALATRCAAQDAIAETVNLIEDAVRADLRAITVSSRESV